MNKDKIKEHIVSINGGSGVLFQPLNSEYSYVLTASHVVDDIATHNGLLNILYFDINESDFRNLNPFNLTENLNYFKHPNQDIAIIKIPRINDRAEIVFINDLDSITQNLSLYGFPSTRASEVDPINRIREDLNLTLSIEKSNSRREGVLADNSTWDELVGQSGGGIFIFKNNYVGLIGIQNKVPNNTESKGRIIFTPVMNFNEIVANNRDNLELLIPNYLHSFSFLESSVFDIKSGMLSREVADTIIRVLKQKTLEISQSECTPSSIRNYLTDNLLLMHGQDQDMVFSKKLWIVWLELLTVLNIAKAKNHSLQDFNNLFSKIRLFYADTDDDFWVSNLHNLAMSNYENLDADGLVVVATNTPALDNFHILNLEKITSHIGAIKKEYDIHSLNSRQVENIPNIGMAVDFPLSKYRFVNISAFKEDCAVNKYEEFNPNEVMSIIIKLKELYEQAISN